MRRFQAIIAAGLTLGLVALAAPAQAESLTFTDPLGDNEYGGLDITGATMKNEQHAFTGKITFASNVKGHVYLVFRTGTAWELIVYHNRLARKDSAYLIDGFSRPVPCDGLSHVWHTATDALTLRVPSSCLNEGTYGDIEARILTDGPYGDDSDHAPDGGGFTPWIPRG